jgi:hypothetical protein
MIDYSTIANTTGTFPDVVATNVSAPGAQDGTPYIKSVVDDLWGARQAAMNYAGLTPDAVTEADGASQQLEAIQKIAGNPGEVIMWHGDASDPSALGVRLLPLNGQGVLVASYPDLLTYCYVGDPSNPTADVYYRADDAGGSSRNTSGIYLILPDMRGQFARGLDTSGTIDPDGASRDIGSIQDDAVEKHNHLLAERSGTPEYGTGIHNNRATTGTASAMTVSTVIGTTDWEADAIEIGEDIDPTSNVTGVGKVAVETRATNVVGRWCIRY